MSDFTRRREYAVITEEDGTAVCYDIRRELVMPGEFKLLAAAVNALLQNVSSHSEPPALKVNVIQKSI
jgi:hypothetical protein